MTIWLSGAEVVTHHTRLAEAGVAHLAINMHSLSASRKNYGGLFSTFEDEGIDVEWVAWTSSPLTATMDTMADITAGIGKPCTWAIGAAAWADMDQYLTTWDGGPTFPVKSAAETGVVGIDKVLLLPEHRTRILSSKKSNNTVGVIGGASAGLSGFDFVVNTSWWHSSSLGELHVWDTEAQTMYRHRPQDLQAKTPEHAEAMRVLGIDYQKILAGDDVERVRLSVMSWMRYSDHLDALAQRTIGSADTPIVTNEVVPLSGIPGLSSVVLANTTPARRKTFPLVKFAEEGEEGKSQVVVRPSNVSLRRCDTCHINQVCPAYEPGETCAYDFPLEIKTKSQRDALMETLITVQTQRVLQARMAEEMQGEGLDEAVGKEIERAAKLIVAVEKGKQSGPGFRLLVEGSGAGGEGQAAAGSLLSRLFPQDTAPARQQAVMAPQQALQAPDVVDGEVVD